MTCQEFVDFLMQYLDGELPADQIARFDEHLQLCADCRRYMASYRATVDLARSLAQQLSAPLPADVPEELIQAILASRPSA